MYSLSSLSLSLLGGMISQMREGDPATVYCARAVGQPKLCTSLRHVYDIKLIWYTVLWITASSHISRHDSILRTSPFSPLLMDSFRRRPFPPPPPPSIFPKSIQLFLFFGMIMQTNDAISHSVLLYSWFFFFFVVVVVSAFQVSIFWAVDQGARWGEIHLSLRFADTVPQSKLDYYRTYSEGS